MKLPPRDLVAVILAVMLAVMIIIHTVLQHFFPVGGTPEAYANIVTVWMDFAKVLVGGLIGYISARGDGEK